MSTKKIKIAFYVLVVSLSLLLVSALALRLLVYYRPTQSNNDKLYTVVYFIATTSLYTSTASLFFLVYFMFKGRAKKK
jgi:hypothetical protein